MPFPEHVVLSPASENDLNVFKHNWGKRHARNNQNAELGCLYSAAVSKVRQPIESLFNWLIEKTGFHNFHKNGSSKTMTP